MGLTPRHSLIAAAGLATLLGACGLNSDDANAPSSAANSHSATAASPGAAATPQAVEVVKVGQPKQRQWWHDAVVYEIWPRSFYDKDGDGHGDFNGMTAKLDYLDNLGINAIWLTPIFSAPSYHGYDYTDFYSVESDYGTMAEFEHFVAQAKQRNIKVVLDLVINHISNAHPWFLKSAAKQNGFDDYFIWRSDKPKAYGHAWGDTPNPDAVWHYHPERKQYYYGAFGASQPDVNLEHPAVIEEMKKMASFWLEKGVEGFRLDAVRYAIEEGPLAGQADTPKTLAYWRDFTAHVKQQNPNAVLVAEAWAPMPKVAKYYDQGKGIDTAFDFDFGFILTDALKTKHLARETSFGESSANTQGQRKMLLQNLKAREQSGAPMYFYSPFLTNHDQNRISENLGGDLTRAKIAAALMLTSPGTPYLYYGEEVGMTQANIGDDVYKRAIMQWDGSDTAGFNHSGVRWLDQAQWTPWMANFTPWWKNWWQQFAHRQQYTVAGQQSSDSLLSLYKSLIKLRKQQLALSQPAEIRLHPSQDSVWLAEYHHPQQTRWVIINMNADKSETVTLPAQLVGTKTELISGNTQTLIRRHNLDAGQVLIF